VVRLIGTHLAGMRANTPPENVYALDLSALGAPGVALWAVLDGDEVVGVGALKALDATSGEIKSMRTDPAHLRRGVAARLLEHLLDEARSRGYSRVSLETGTGEAFEPALALYRRHGFTNGPAFGEYRATAFNQFLHLDL
jgi:putative acetyltransferase